MEVIVLNDELQPVQGAVVEAINAVEEDARKNGCTSIWLDVINTNHRAHDLYRRLGFEEMKERKFGILTKRAGFTSAIKMKKKISLG